MIENYELELLVDDLYLFFNNVIFTDDNWAGYC